MSASPTASPPPDSHQHLHQRLVDRDPTAPDDIADTFLEPLINWLTEYNRGIHPDLINEAAEEAILAVIRNPASYRPLESNLESYLRMSAQADLRNLLRRETTYRSRHQRLEIVELSPEGGKYTGREDDPSLGLMIEEELARLPETIPESIREGLTDIEARVLDLLLRQERRTAIYADACGLADRPPEEQRRLVQRIKNRLTKRIERQGGPSSLPLERLAKRVRSDPFFLAAPLARYAESQELDDHALAARLGCDGDTLTHLRLCRNPDSMPPHFWKDVERIAARFHLDPDQLAEVVRFGQALLQARPPAAAPVTPAPGYLMAAREDTDGELPPEKDT